MAWKTVSNLVFLWGNTGLSPPIQRRKESEGSIEFVVAQIKQLRAEYDFAVLGLGEVNSEELDAIIEGVGDPALAKMDATDHTQRLKFDTAIVYDLTKLAQAQAREATSWTSETHEKPANAVFSRLELQIHPMFTHSIPRRAVKHEQATTSTESVSTN